MGAFTVTSPDGTEYEINAPEGATEAQVLSYARQKFGQPKPTIVTDKSVPDSAPPPVMQAPPKPRTLTDTVKGALVGIGSVGIEAPLAIGTGMVGGLVGAGTALANKAFGATDDDAARRGVAVRDAMTYQPKNEAGQDAAAGFGHLVESSGIMGVPIPTLNALGQAAPAARAYAGSRAAVAADAGFDAAVAAPGRLREAIRPTPSMGGGGAAEVDAARLARTRAETLDVPMSGESALTQAQQTRQFAAEQAEGLWAKDPDLGEGLRQRRSNQHQVLAQNFDSFIDETGQTGGNSLRFTGERVYDAILAKMTEAKKAIAAAYTKARDSGAMGERIDAAPMLQFFFENEASRSAAPILVALENNFRNLLKGDTQMSINDLEMVRRQAGKLAGTDQTAKLFAVEIKRLIDEMTNGRGGEDYKAARKLRTLYGDEFQRTGAIAKLVEMKKGTLDRRVAFEDVMRTTMLDGSLDDVRAVRKTLQTFGAQGQQAWRELQGSMMEDMKSKVMDKITSKDVNNRPVPSPDAFNKMVNNLDADGRLDFIYGKVPAQKIRNLRDVALDAFTSPQGSVNASNNAGLIVSALAAIESGLVASATFAMTGTAIPAPILSATKFGLKKAKDRATAKQIRQHLNYEPPP